MRLGLLLKRLFRKALAKFLNFFYEQLCPNCIKAFIATLLTNFQLNIFIFEARASLRTLLQSLKQRARKLARAGYLPAGRKFFDTNFQTFFFEKIFPNSIKIFLAMPESKLPSTYEFSAKYLQF